jgi:hypothetical protein
MCDAKFLENGNTGWGYTGWVSAPVDERGAEGYGGVAAEIAEIGDARDEEEWR